MWEESYDFSAEFCLFAGDLMPSPQRRKDRPKSFPLRGRGTAVWRWLRWGQPCRKRNSPTSSPLRGASPQGEALLLPLVFHSLICLAFARQLSPARKAKGLVLSLSSTFPRANQSPVFRHGGFSFMRSRCYPEFLRRLRFHRIASAVPLLCRISALRLSPRRRDGLP